MRTSGRTRRVTGWVLLAIVTVAAFGGAHLWRFVHTMEVERLSPELHMLSGAGSNVAIFRTAAGPVVVDTMTFASQGRQIADAAEKLAGARPVAIINTHYHLDHTHGNPGFDAGTEVIATASTLRHLLARDASHWDGDAASLLPSRTFDTEEILEIGGKRIRCLHLGRGHTDGDLVVLFEDERVLHAGDLFFNGRFPNIDLEAGGSIEAWIGTIDRILELDVDLIIPGHGPVSDKDGLRRFQGFLRELWAVGQEAAREKRSLSATLRSAQLPSAEGMETIAVPFVFRFDRDFVVRRAWEEATGTVRPDGKAAAKVPTP